MIFLLARLLYIIKCLIDCDVKCAELGQKSQSRDVCEMCELGQKSQSQGKCDCELGQKSQSRLSVK